MYIYIWSHTPPEPPTINLYQIYLPHGKLFSSMLCGGQRWAEKLRERPEMETNDWNVGVCLRLDMCQFCVQYPKKMIWIVYSEVSMLEISGCDLNQVVFPLQRGAICPGTYFCAEEHQPCICNGEITYGPVLFDGYRHLDKPGPAAFPTIFCWLGQFQWIPFGSS